MELETRLFTAALTAGLVGFTLASYRKRSPFHVGLLALVFSATVACFYPVLSSLFEAGGWRRIDRISEEILAATQRDHLAFVAGLSCALLLLPRAFEGAVRTETEELRAALRTRDTVVVCGLLGGGLALYALYAARVGIATLADREDYAAKYLASQGLGGLRFGLKLAIAGCLWAEAGRVSRLLRMVARGAALGILVWTIAFLSVRTNFVLLAIGYAAIHARRTGFVVQRVRWFWIVGGALLWVGLEGFSLFRGTYRGDTVEALQLVAERADEGLSKVVGASELSHPFVTAMEVHACADAGDLAGSSYLDALAILLPRALVSERPESLPQWFARTQYSDLFARGGGTAFSIVAEAWMNFGALFGPWLVGLFFGAVAVWAEERARRVPFGVVARTLPYFAFLAVILQRSAAANLIKYVASLAAPVALLVVVAEVLHAARERGVRPVAWRGAGGRP